MSQARDLRQRQAEFEREAMPHSPSLVRAARRLTFDAALAEDLAQETLLRAWRSFDQFQAGTNLRAWLFRILFNAYYAHGRAQSARPLLLPWDAAVHAVASPGSFRISPAQIENADVAAAFAALSEEHQAVLSLVVIEGFTCRETSEILSVPMGTVMSRIARARVALRERLVDSGSISRKARPPLLLAAKR